MVLLGTLWRNWRGHGEAHSLIRIGWTLRVLLAVRLHLLHLLLLVHVLVVLHGVLLLVRVGRSSVRVDGGGRRPILLHIRHGAWVRQPVRLVGPGGLRVVHRGHRGVGLPRVGHLLLQLVSRVAWGLHLLHLWLACIDLGVRADELPHEQPGIADNVPLLRASAAARRVGELSELAVLVETHVTRGARPTQRVPRELQFRICGNVQLRVQ